MGAKTNSDNAGQGRAPDCCPGGSAWELPDLAVSAAMLEMNYGCATTVRPADLDGDLPVLYFGVGAGVEALQFAYFRRRPGGVIAIDPVAEMRSAAARNLDEASRVNPWFRPDFVTILDGAADALPVDNGSVGLVAQNCLFNVFIGDELRAVLAEVVRVLAPGGRFFTCDPIATEPLPQALKNNPTLRARCVSGCLTYDEYVGELAGAGFRKIAVRERRPYRILTQDEYPELLGPVVLETLEVLATKAALSIP